MKSCFHHHRDMNMCNEHIAKDRLKRNEYEKSVYLWMQCVALSELVHAEASCISIVDGPPNTHRPDRANRGLRRSQGSYARHTWLWAGTQVQLISRDVSIYFSEKNSTKLISDIKKSSSINKIPTIPIPISPFLMYHIINIFVHALLFRYWC